MAATYLDQLTPTSTRYTVRVKIVEKARKSKCLPDGWTHQTFVIEDDKGNNMKGRLLGAQVEAYRDILVYRGDYEISNAPITYCPGHWKSHLNQLDHIIGIDQHTSIKSMAGHMGTPYPQYTCLENIPRAPRVGARYDVLGILLATDQAPRLRETGTEYKFPEKDIVIVDSSANIPVKVTLTCDLSETVFEASQDSEFGFTLVGLTALHAYTTKDFRSTSSISTEVINKPRGSEATTLAKWAIEHKEDLAQMRTTIPVDKDCVHGKLGLLQHHMPAHVGQPE